VRLANGNVLMVAGTRNGGWAEIFDPTTQTWRAAPRPASPHSQLVRLHGGNVLALGWLYNRPKVCVERFLVREHRWEPAGERKSLCADRGATWVMRDGRVLFQTGRRHVFVYNPATNAWRRFASVPIPREPRPLWIEGFVGVAGQPMAIATRSGCRPDGGRTVGYRWQPREHRWAEWTKLRDGTGDAAVAQLRDGSVLVSGGVQWPGPCGTVGATHVPSRFAYRYYP
jgi:hypothetical protein